MTNIYISESISDSTLITFMEEVNNAPDKEKIVVYLCSTGGNPSLVPMFQHIIERHQMKLVACSLIYSSALSLFLLTNTPREVLKDTIGLVHRMTVRGVNTDKRGFVIEDSKVVKIWSETDDSEDIPPLFDMTKKEIKQMNKGKDFYFDYKELRKALKKSEEKFANNK